MKEALYTLSGIWAAYTHVGSFLLQMLWCKRKLGKIALSFSGSISISHFPHSFCILPLSPPLSTFQRSFFLWFWVLHPFVKSNAQMCATISKSWKGPSRVCLASSFILYLLCWVRGSKPRTCLRSCNQLARDLEESRALSSKPSHANILSPCTHIALSSTSSVFSIILSILPPISGFSVMTNSTFTFFWLFSQDLIQE